MLLAIAAIGLAVRLSSAITSGWIVCINVDIDSDHLPHESLQGQYLTALSAYAAQDEGCHDQVVPGPEVSQVMEYSCGEAVHPRLATGWLHGTWASLDQIFIAGSMKFASTLMLIEV